MNVDLKLQRDAVILALYAILKVILVITVSFFKCSLNELLPPSVSRITKLRPLFESPSFLRPSFIFKENFVEVELKNCFLDGGRIKVQKQSGVSIETEK